MAIFPGKVTVDVGASGASKVSITNVKRLILDRGPDDHIKPQTVMNTVPPVGWHKGHKWVTGELHVLSEQKAAFKDQGVAYIVEASDNVEIPYVVATLTPSTGAARVRTFTGFIISSVREPYADGEDAIWCYRFKAKYVEDA